MVGEPVCIGTTDDLRKKQEGRVLEAIDLYDGLEGTVAPMVAKLDPRGVEGQAPCLLGHLLDLPCGHEEEVSLGIDTAPD